MASTVRAKFHVVSKTLSAYSKDAEGKTRVLETVKLSPVYGNSPENKAFFDASPSGSIELGVLNPAAAGALVIGEEYFIDFTPAKDQASTATFGESPKE